MEFFPKALDRAESDAQMAHIRESIADDGLGYYAVEVGETGAFIGFVGPGRPNLDAPFMPAIEIGWRLARESWGNGYATEAAGAVVDHAFGSLGLDALVSYTTEWNRRSRRVMEKIGMTRDPRDDFMHPNLPAGHKLAPHVLYRIDRAAWLTRPQAAG
jgi:ribosomal-protein-alanine N-acetyltransferase